MEYSSKVIDGIWTTFTYNGPKGTKVIVNKNTWTLDYLIHTIDTYGHLSHYCTAHNSLQADAIVKLALEDIATK